MQETTNTNTAIHIRDLEFSWMKKNWMKKGRVLPCLTISDWKVQRGEKIFLQGASGSGKSTLLNILSGMLLPQKGDVNVLGQTINQMNATARDRFRAQYLGVIFQQFNLIPYLSALDNIRLSGVFAKGSTHNTYSKEHNEEKHSNADNERIALLCHQLNLPLSILDQSSSELSIGQQQRVAAARALLHSPPIIIADEPTSALDTDNRNEFIQLLLQESERTSSTVLFVSHDTSLAHYFDRVEPMTTLQSTAMRG